MTTLTLQDLFPIESKLELKHPTQGDIGITLSIASPDSKVVRNAMKLLVAEDLHYRAVLEAKEFKDRTAADYKTSVEKAIELKDNQAAVFITGWSGPNAAAFGEYSPKRAAELLAMPELQWVADQVAEVIAERNNFFRQRAEVAV